MQDTEGQLLVTQQACGAFLVPESELLMIDAWRDVPVVGQLQQHELNTMTLVKS